MAYYTRSKAFQQDQEAWAMAKDPGLFWQMHYDHCKELYLLATRLLHTLANSVPSERSFSSEYPTQQVKESVDSRKSEENAVHSG